ncbi:hypothetical protein NOR_00929 [Metarhizium rileyi]|uniref:Uncharacterized protein n=1 Tax=Metarhizium rileyi (strain RCEF 4871) TaxID=1649241 RepID=A0A167JM40_METRR|nr:hypothetical protein NOR_00929 [Metarhizium rileyi RCEF 4871]
MTTAIYDSYNHHYFQTPPVRNYHVMYESERYSMPPAFSHDLNAFMNEDYCYYYSDGDEPRSALRRYSERYEEDDPGHTRLRPHIDANRAPAAVHMDPDDPKDITVHMALQTTPDAENFLQQNAQLRRLGHFDAAISQFEKDLASSLDNIYVRVQYGHCLYDARMYRKLAELANKYPFIEMSDEVPVGSAGDLILNWNLLLQKAEALDELDFGGTIEADGLTPKASQYLKYRRLDSTEVQLPRHHDNMIITRDEEIRVISFETNMSNLKYDQRIWDFRDLFLALQEKMGLKKAGDLIVFYDERTFSPIESIIADWSDLDEDESTYFGALDLFSSLAFACMEEKGNMKDAENCLQVAAHFSTYLLKKNMNNKDDDNIFFKGALRGKYPMSGMTFPYKEMPLYAPLDDEVPEWKPKASGISDAAKKTTRVVLKAAEEIGDVPMQVGCLQQLLDQGSDNPSREIERINELWMHSAETSLTTASVGTPDFTEYSRCMILRALSSKFWEERFYMKRANRIFPDTSHKSGYAGYNDEVSHDRVGKVEVVVVEESRKRASS